MMHSPMKLGLQSRQSSFGGETGSKHAYLGDRRYSGLEEGELISEVRFHYV
jgi:hypothetical protein